jgi:ribosomal protein S18 acetylase RimI-like enzyme
MSTVHVRRATVSDIESLADLFDRYRQFQGRQSDLAQARAFLEARLEHDQSILFLAEQGQGAVGFAQLYPSFSSVSLARVFILNDVFVSAESRRQGVASRLLDALEGFAWSHGAVRLTLSAARGNTSAQALYEARGWERDSAFYVYHRHSVEG